MSVSPYFTFYTQGSNGAALLPIPSGMGATDTILQVAVLSPGSGSFSVGQDVTADFSANLVTVPNLPGVSNPGTYLYQSGAVNLSGATLLFVIQRG